MAINMNRIRNKIRGMSLIEMLVYVAVLALIFVLVISTIVSFTKSYKDVAANRRAERAGIDVLERISREIRDADSITVAQSTFGSNPGALTLVKTSGGTSTTTRFYIDAGVAKVDVNGTYSGPLTSSRVSVTELYLYRLTNSNTEAVKIDLTVQGTSGSVTKTKSFDTTVILKGS